MWNPVKVGPSVITINQGSTFMVTTEAGEIAPDSELGFFFHDTRLISEYRLSIEGKPWLLATAAAVSYYGARHYFVSPRIQTDTEVIAERQIELKLERSIGGGIHEDYDLTNYGTSAARFVFEITLDADFADLFEVKAHQVTRRGHIDSLWEATEAQLLVRYVNADFERAVSIRFRGPPSQPHFANGKIRFDIALPASGSWHCCCFINPVIDGDEHESSYPCHAAVEGTTELDRLQHLWQRSATKIETPNIDVQRAFDQAVIDMGALRLYEHDIDDEVWMPGAGVPWFVTLFGRDSLIASYQNMLASCPLANGTLHRLAQFQASERDDWRDAQPGKILHEARFGELAHFNRIPHTPYFGTADATILYLIVLSETFLWTADERILRDHRDTALRCLEWIDRFGDIDQDGFQEYRSFSTQGYRNMGWKDAGDAVMYPDGRPVEPPIATCELQGYVYDAKLRMARIFEMLGEPATAEQLRGDAGRLKRQFNKIFWIEEEGFYAYALAPDKEPVRTIASNPGHLLWSGIVEPADRAVRVAERLLQSDMFSGWGIRTLAENNPAYNPHEYQRGSVWPHDNSLIAAGFKRYGLWQEANRVAAAMFDACAAFQGYRLPELFAGLDRMPGSFPVQYIGANVPQAWAAGAVFLLLRTIIGIEPDMPNNKVYLNPTLPEWLPNITIKDLRLGAHTVSIAFQASVEKTKWDVLNNDGGIELAATEHTC